MIRLLVSLVALGTIHAQVDPPEVAVKVISAAPVADHIQIHVKNASKKDITYVSGMATISLTAESVPVQTRVGIDTLHDYILATKLPGLERRDSHGKKIPLATLMAGEEITKAFKPLQGGSTVTFVPDLVIYADQTYSGNPKVADEVFRERKRIASEYGKVGKAVYDAEHSPDPASKYQETLAAWLPKTGITTTATSTVIHGTKEFPTPTPYYQLQAYAGIYTWAVQELAAQRAHGNNAVTLEALIRPRIKELLHHDSVLGASYKLHSEAK